MKIARILAILVLSLVLAGGAAADLSLVWSDEFEGAELDLANWTTDYGDGCPDLCGWGNNELEWYLAENVSVENGDLVLTAREEYFGGRYFTSGKVHTRDKHSFLYGRIEARAKIPTGGGMWPAFWMMPQDDAYGGWASSGEIDIMESANSTTWIDGTLHFGGEWPNNSYSAGDYSPAGVNFSDDYHVYAIEWEEDQIRWYVDDVLYSTKYYWQWWSNGAPGNDYAPFDQPFYIILNTAVGGNYTGCIYPYCVEADLPQEFRIDYVRVYQETSNQAPEVLVTYPTEADDLLPGDYVIEAEASDSDGTVERVEFFEGSTYLGEDDTAPYTCDWTGVTDGCFQISATAHDDQGAFSTDTADITVGTGCGQAPYTGSAILLPAIVEAEDYDLGGEGIAYHDSDPGNNGNSYRGDDVDIQACTDSGGGYNLGWVIEGEWTEYAIESPVHGEYPIEIRVASLSQGGVFHLEFDGVDLTGDVTVPATGGWQTWTTVSATATLEAGSYVMRFVPTDEGFNINRFEFMEPLPVNAPETPPAGFALHACYPNPFNPITTVSFSLEEGAEVTLSVHDVAGRHVCTLIEGQVLEAGEHEKVWRGRDQAGRNVSAGVYLLKLQAGGEVQTRRAALVK